MGTCPHGRLPPDLVQGQRRFRRWREQRKPATGIPQPLRSMAIRLAKAHGASRTSAALGLDYYSLTKRAEATAPPRSSGPAFLELTPPVLVARQCQLELDNGFGATMRIQSVGYDAADIGRTFRRGPGIIFLHVRRTATALFDDEEARPGNNSRPGDTGSSWNSHYGQY
jgi:hypothetical protein